MQSLKSLISVTVLTCGLANAALISHYTFDETSGLTAADSGSAGATGAIGSNVTLGTPGVFGTAFTFVNDASQNGVVDMGNAATFADLNTSQALTVSVWLKWTSSTDNRDTAVFLGSSSVSDRYLDIGTTGGVNTANLGGVFGRNRAGATFPDMIRSSGLNDGQWHHIAYTVDAVTDVTQLYIDGVLAGTTTTPLFTFPAFNNFEVGRLGRSAPTDAYAGSVDELRIYDAVLSAGEITALAQGPAGDPGIAVASSFTFTNSGAAETFSIPFSNTGATQTLVLTAPTPVTITGSDAASFTVSSFDNNLAPGAAGAIALQFTPATPGFYAATLTIASNDALQPSREVAIEVEVTDPIAGVSPVAIDFGSFAAAPGPQTSTLTITNDGGAQDLTVSNLTVTGSPAFTVDVPLPITVAPGTSTGITVTFTPGSAGGNFAANLEVTTDGYNQQVFNIPLTAQVKFSNPDATLVSLFTFDGEANVGDDSGPSNHDGTAVGDAKRTSSARIGAGALLLDGAGDLIDLGVGSGATYGPQLIADSDGFTVACWAHVPAATVVDRTRFFSAYANGASALSEGWGVGQRNTSRALVGTTYGKADYLTPVNVAPAPGAWHHYAYVFRNVPVNRVDFYLDGVLVDSRTTTVTGFTDPTTVGFAIGALGRATAFEGFEGRLDDLRIYNRELPGSNIADLYNSAPELAGYAAWAGSYGLDPAGDGLPSEDPDRDGIANSVEFLLGSSPVSGASLHLPVASENAGGLSFGYRREVAALEEGFVDQVEYSDVLTGASWVTAVHNVGGVTISSILAPDGETEEVTVTIPATAGRIFARLRVTTPQ
ncbi:LamG-like jellyroll fold domain-containing protein [Luteolibacter sp. Populi]|uniref:LamG-like jellyroll fold domain-containing protein n=1 Tax=Luteolibacter sp. Populi TaxID=3230487 RepID=UPI003465E477